MTPAPIPTSPTPAPDAAGRFRAAMRRLAATVTVVSTRSGGTDHGMTATAVTSLSMSPPSLLVCVNTASSIFGLLERGGRFCVNVLREGQRDQSEIFGSSAGGPRRFGEGAWRHAGDGTPYLDDAQAAIFCTIDEIVPYGTHVIVIGRVEDARVHEVVAPLIYVDGGYTTPQVPA